MLFVAEILYIVQVIDVIVDRIPYSSANLGKKNLHLTTLLMISRKKANFFLKVIIIIFLAGSSEGIVQIFLTGGAEAVVHPGEHAIHIQVIPGGIINLKALPVFQVIAL